MKAYYKLPISELEGEFVKSTEEFEPHKLITKSNLTVSKVHIWGKVTEKFTNEGNTVVSITLDDQTGTIQCKAFNDSVFTLLDYEQDQFVEVLGKVRQDQSNFIYILADMAKPVDKDDISFKTSETKAFFEIVKKKLQN